jgi:hypothetical protein
MLALSVIGDVTAVNDVPAISPVSHHAKADAVLSDQDGGAGTTPARYRPITPVLVHQVIRCRQGPRGNSLLAWAI